MTGVVSDLSSSLSGVTVVVLSGVASEFCGYLLAQWGASVTKFRDATPTGSPVGSFALAYDRGCTVELFDPADTRHLEARIAAADVVVTDSAVRDCPVSRERIAALNGAVIHADITLFGSTGPHAQRHGGDLIANAASGFLHLTGTPGRTPVRMGADQAAKLAGAEACAAILIALHHRDGTGRGQHLDIAMRDAMIRATVNALPLARYEGTIQQRVGDYWGVRDRPLKSLWRTQDGWVSFVRRGGALGGRVNHACVAWIAEAGFDVGDLHAVDWDAMDLDTEQDRAKLDELDGLFERFLATQETQAVFEEGLRRGMTIAPVRTLEGVLDERQLEARDYWATEKVAGRDIRFPRFTVKSSQATGPHGPDHSALEGAAR